MRRSIGKFKMVLYIHFQGGKTAFVLIGAGITRILLPQRELWVPVLASGCFRFFGALPQTSQKKQHRFNAFVNFSDTEIRIIFVF